MSAPTMKTPAPFAACVIVWEDAFGDAGVDYDSPSACLRSWKPMIRKSHGIWIGWAVKDGRRAAVICTDDDRTDDSPDAVGSPSFIPEGMVLRIEPLRIAPPPRKKRR